MKDLQKTVKSLCFRLWTKYW